MSGELSRKDKIKRSVYRNCGYRKNKDLGKKLSSSSKGFIE